MKDLKLKLRHFFKNSLPFFLILFVVLIFFWKIVVKGYVPIPGDMVVGTYYPWLDYKWGYSVGVPVKNPITADVPSFIYPMQTLGIKMLKSGQWPLWNPYILSGTPLLANFQSAPFSPVNFLYFLFDQLTAWSVQIISQHIVAAAFAYLLLRYWKISKPGSLLGGLIFSFSGFNLIWSQWNGHTLAAAFIPLLILLTQKLLDGNRLIGGVLISFVLAFQILSGYPQAVFYSILAIVTLWLFNIRKNKDFWIRSLLLGLFSLIGIGLSAFQILPGAELLKYSQREIEPLSFDWSTLPWMKTITFVAPDFFGNHATANYWGPQDYTSNTGFVGMAGFVLALIAIGIKHRKGIYFSLAIVIISLLFALPTPVSLFFWKSGFVGLNAAAAHRSLILFNLGAALLAGFGFDALGGKNRINLFSKIFAPVLVFGLLLGAAGYAYLLRDKIIFGASVLTVALRNLVVPTGISLAAFFIIFFKPRLKYFLIVLSIAEIFYFGWKFTPFSPRSIVFPTTPILEFLMKQEKPFRVTGSRVIPVNMRMPYMLESLEGYDAVYPLRMSQFLAALNGGKSGTEPLGRYALVDNDTSPLLDLVNTKYYIVNNFDAKGKPSPSGTIPARFATPRFKVAIRDKSVSIMESVTALPRAFMVYDWEIENDNEKILNKLLDSKYPLGKKIILEEPVLKSSGGGGVSTVKYTEYSETKSALKVNTDNDGFLFISEAFFPGWKVYIDGKEGKIYRADFAFRTVFIPEGDHKVEFVYWPDSFASGILISGITLGLLMIIGLYIIFIYKRKTFGNWQKN